MKNNIQKPSKQTKTAGKYMFLGKGPLAEKFMGKGVKFDKKSFVKLANCWSMKEEPMESSEEEEENQKEQDYHEEEEQEKDEEGGVAEKKTPKKSSKRRYREVIVSDDDNLTIDPMNMRKYAKKVKTPGFL